MEAVDVSDDDWFERALREAEESDGSDEDGSDDAADADSNGENAAVADPTADDEDPFGGGGSDGSSSGESEDPFGGGSDGSSGGESEDPFGGGGGSDGSTGSDAEDPFGSGGSGSDGSSGSNSEDPFGGGGGSADDPFGQSFADALQNAPSPDGVDGGGGPDFGSGGGDGPDFGGGGGGPAFGGGGGGGGDGPDFGGGGGGGGPDFDTDYDDGSFESDLERLDIGIEGLDNMIRGGVPVRSLMVAVGSAGTGKTTFGLQFIQTALAREERAVYITLEETRQRVLDSAEEKGWSFRQYEEEGLLAVLDLDPIDMANSLTSIRNDLPRLVEDFGAERLVLDSVSLLEMMYDRPSKRRSEVFEFSRSLKEAGVTTMVTSEASDDTPYASRYGIIEYLADAVFVLQYVRPNDFQETRLAIEIQKIRDAHHSRQPKPYEISDEGISVHQQANIF